MVYLTACLTLGKILGLWNSALLWESITWVVISGTVLWSKFSEVGEDGLAPRKLISGTVGWAILLQFLLNIHSFPLWVEILLQLWIAFLVLAIIPLSKEQSNSTRPAIQRLLHATILILAIFSILSIIRSWDEIDFEHFSLAFALPIWLTAVAIPAVWMMRLISRYEDAFMRIGWINGRQRVKLRHKLLIISALRWRVEEVSALVRLSIGTTEFPTSSAQIRAELVEHRDTAAAKRRERQEIEDRFKRYAGVKGTDERGAQLDNREFSETRSALKHLSFAQMGWYRRDGAYLPDLLDIVGKLSVHGLPEEHGVTIAVSEDRQAWAAWRQTVTGWWFGIGASGAPSDEWLYDGAVPPESLPGIDSKWCQFGSGDDCVNWNQP
jgi:hypothetical protein